MRSIADRIRELIDSKGLSNTEFAKATDLNPAIISHILSGRNKPSLQVISHIKSAFTNVNTDYLLAGEGNLYKQFTNVNKPKEEALPASAQEHQLFRWKECGWPPYPVPPLLPIARHLMNQYRIPPGKSLRTEFVEII
ncbi:MAG: helix-turn-helix transcriptional regulator [Owenweeksia sp.]|nr:helix-turn-helix transcriptional regulator [Owenweeksia sp.]